MNFCKIFAPGGKSPMTDRNITTFTNYVTQKIEKARTHREKSTEIRCDECPALGKVLESGRDNAREVYNVVEANCFNQYGIGLFFAGYDLGSVVTIYYLAEKQDFDKDPNFEKIRDDVTRWCQGQMKEQKESFVVDLKSIPDIPESTCTGFWWPYMYYQVSERLRPQGWYLHQTSEGSTECRPIPSKSLLQKIQGLFGKSH